MRILFINTTDIAGGAAVVMQRLMQGLHRQYKTENLLLVKTKEGNAPQTKSILSDKAAIIAEKIIDRVTRKLGLLYQSFPFSSSNLLAATRSFRPDVISLHNTHGGYFATPLVYKLSRLAPVVWTLHDMWSFTGNASHAFGNMSWKSLKNDAELTKIPPAIGINTGSLLLRQKRSVYRKSRLTVVAPSLWLKDLALQSPVFSGKEINHIYNGVDTRVFAPQGKEEARQRLQLPPSSPVIIFISHFLNKNNPWKGGADLLNILREMDRITDKKITLLMLGQGRLAEAEAFSNLQIMYRGYVEGDEAVSECLRAADLFIYPTRADNLPNVLVEAIACGTPCITFDIGGNKEIVRHNMNGIIVSPFDITAFAAYAVSLLGDRSKLTGLASNCLKIAREHFMLEDMIQNYYALFEKVVQKSQN